VITLHNERPQEGGGRKGGNVVSHCLVSEVREGGGGGAQGVFLHAGQRLGENVSRGKNEGKRHCSLVVAGKESKGGEKKKSVVPFLR